MTHRTPLRFTALLLLVLLWFSGCGNPNDAYLQQTEPSIEALMGTWRDLNQTPKADKCLEISKRLKKIESQLQPVKAPDGSLALHGLLLASLKLQTEDVAIKTRIDQLMTGTEEPKLGPEERNKEFKSLRAKTEENAKAMAELSKKIQAELQKL